MHFHFVFSIKHLENACFDVDASQRQVNHESASALLTNVYEIYWDRTLDEFQRILKPSIEADRQMRSATQWRRNPGAVRVLEKKSVLGIPEGTRVRQVVIREKIRDRAPKGSSVWLVCPTHSLRNPISRRRTNLTETDHNDPVNPEKLVLLQQMCLNEWGTYPKPVQIGRQGKGWIIHFKNHKNDRKPSTFVLGEYRKT